MQHRSRRELRVELIHLFAAGIDFVVLNLDPETPIKRACVFERIHSLQPGTQVPLLISIERTIDAPEFGQFLIEVTKLLIEDMAEVVRRVHCEAPTSERNRSRDDTMLLHREDVKHLVLSAATGAAGGCPS